MIEKAKVQRTTAYHRHWHNDDHHEPGAQAPSDASIVVFDNIAFSFMMPPDLMTVRQSTSQDGGSDAAAADGQGCQSETLTNATGYRSENFRTLYSA